jgi:hypothetical protein
MGYRLDDEVPELGLEEPGIIVFVSSFLVLEALLLAVGEGACEGW